MTRSRFALLECLGSVLCVPFFLAGALLPGAPAPRPNFALRLTISLDRKVYLPYEPIFVEWGIMNGRDQAIKYAPIASSTRMHFEYTDPQGEKGVISNPTVVDYVTPPPFFPIGPRRTARHWMDLREYAGLRGAGEFKIQAVCPVAYTLAGNPEPVITTLRSREVAFKVVDPEGADRAAVRLIEGAFPASPLPDDTPQKKVLEEAIHLEHLRNTWTFRGQLSDRLLTKTKSGRFHAAANFYLGYLLVQSGTIPAATALRQEELAAGRQHLSACLFSKDSSHYMKGLSAYYLMLGELEKGTPETRKEAEKRARALRADYPDTFMADEAQTILPPRSTTTK